MTNEELQAIKARAEAATPGPWGTRGLEIICGDKWPWDLIADTYLIEHDAPFIAAARADVPALIAEVRRLQDDARRLEHYQQFVAQISEALGVPDDSMILPHAQEMAAEITRLRAELAAVPVGEIDDSISAWQRGEFDDLAMRVLLRWREETTKNDDVVALPADNPPTSGFFTSGRWDFSEA